jgi:hypothetical protein
MLGPMKLIARACFVLCLLVPVAAHADDDVREHVAELSSRQASERRDAAEELGELDIPPAFAVLALLKAARREPDVDALGEMLVTLGKSGTMEALGLIQTHALSPIDKLRRKGREALKLWLVCNRILHEDDELPAPPHPFYEPPPAIPPDRVAGHSLAVWLGPRDQDFSQPTDPAPVYERVDPDGVPAGYRLEEHPRWGIVGLGVGVFAGTYVMPLIARGFESQGPGDRFDELLLIPVAGPIARGANLLDEGSPDANEGMGALMIFGAMGQTLGIVATIAGAATTTESLELAFTPSGATLTGAF